MLEGLTKLAERLVSQGGVSRRGFLGWVGRRAAAVALGTGGLLAAAPFVQAAGGRRCRDNSHCGPRKYCQKDPGDCNGIGHCVDRPQICPLFCVYLCGCDGQTYCNECLAARAGVNVASFGGGC